LDVLAGQTVSLGITLTDTDLAAGNYSSTLRLNHNTLSSNLTTTEIPVTLSLLTALLAVDTNLLECTVAGASTANFSTVVSNPGGAPTSVQSYVWIGDFPSSQVSGLPDFPWILGPGASYPLNLVFSLGSRGAGAFFSTLALVRSGFQDATLDFKITIQKPVFVGPASLTQTLPANKASQTSGTQWTLTIRNDGAVDKHTHRGHQCRVQGGVVWVCCVWGQ
jgi:hypothetical protein